MSQHPKHTWVTDFLEFQFGDAQGQIRLAVMESGSNFTEHMARWPEHKDTIADWALAQSVQGKDVYYTPALYVTPDNAVSKNKKGRTTGERVNVQDSQVVWVDLDGKAPGNWKEFAAEKGIPEPSLVIQSSTKDRQHVYWRLEQRVTADDLESINRGLALVCGADNSGWDATQLLRIPFTANHGFRKEGVRKDWFAGESVEVNIVGNVSTGRLNRELFERVSHTPSNEPVSKISSNLPSLFDVATARTWPEALKETFQLTKEEAAERSPNKRSGTLQRLAYEAVEAGFNDEQVFVIVEDADRRWEKYANRKPESRFNILSDIVARARQKSGSEELEFNGFVQEVQADNLNLAWGFADFMDAEIPPTEWIFRGLIPKNSYGFITAQPGVGKTQLSLQVSLAAALGKNFLNFDIGAGKQKVLYFSLEMIHGELMDTLRSITEGYDENAIRMLQKNFHIVPADNFESMPLDKPEGREFFERFFLTTLKPDIIVIDSLTEIISKTVNDDETALSVSKYFNYIRMKYNTAIVIIHHNRKISNEAKAQGKPPELSDLYGSQWWSAKAQYAIAVRKTDKPDILGMLSMKMRAARDFSMHIRRNDNLVFTVVNETDELEKNEVTIGGGFFQARDAFGTSPEGDGGIKPPSNAEVVRHSPPEPNGGSGISESSPGEESGSGHGDDGATGLRREGLGNGSLGSIQAPGEDVRPLLPTETPRPGELYGGGMDGPAGLN